MHNLQNALLFEYASVEAVAYTTCLIISFSAILNACLGAKLPIVVSPCYNADTSCLSVNAIVELEDNRMKLQSNCEQ